MREAAYIDDFFLRIDQREIVARGFGKKFGDLFDLWIIGQFLGFVRGSQRHAGCHGTL